MVIKEYHSWKSNLS